MSIFLYVAEFTGIVAPFAVLILIMIDPCTPPFLLSFHAGCADIAWISGDLKIFVVLFEAWVTLQLFSAGAPWVYYILFAGIVSILDYFQVLKRLQISK